MLVWGIGIVIVLGEMVRYRIFREGSLQMAYNYPLTVILSVAIMFFAMSLQQVCHKDFSVERRSVLRTGKLLVTGLSRLSFTIYLIHPLFLNILYKVLHVTPADHPVVITLPFFFEGTLICSVVSAWFLHKITPLRKYVL